MKENRGGKREGAGRKPGITFKEQTKVRRIPVSLLPKVDAMIEKHKVKKIK